MEGGNWLEVSPLPFILNEKAVKVPEGLALPSARTRQGARLIRRGKSRNSGSVALISY